ncbi:hypothetical protein HZC08_00510, partial [Candidatus Micrarchaeota archaeon]|nr:hypothetical protein [Candidatus Micrarchaeota archaeon]
AGIKVGVRSISTQTKNERMRAHRLFSAINYRTQVFLASEAADVQTIKIPPKPTISIRPHKHLLR